MEDQETLYNRLRDLYSKETPSRDSIAKGTAIEKLVNRLISEIVAPLETKTYASLGSYEFDGKINLSRARSIYYEIQLGTLPKFKFDQITELALKTEVHYLRRNYILTIAYNFSTVDKEIIRKLVKKISSRKTRVNFVDYETLISLHKFTKEIEKSTTREMGRIKRLFLEDLLERDPIILESYFEDALSSSQKRYGEWEISAAAKGQRALLLEPPLDEKRIERLEKIAQELLYEIRELRNELMRARRKE